MSCQRAQLNKFWPVINPIHCTFVTGLSIKVVAHITCTPATPENVWLLMFLVNLSRVDAILSKGSKFVKKVKRSKLHLTLTFRISGMLYPLELIVKEITCTGTGTLADKCLPPLLPDLLLHSEHDLPIVEALNYSNTNQIKQLKCSHQMTTQMLQGSATD